MGELNVPIWGKPTIFWGDKKLEVLEGHTNLVLNEESDIKDDGKLFDCSVWRPKPITFSFDVDVKPETIRSIRKLFTMRIPRKAKKRIKSMMAKRLGIKQGKLRFNLQWFNNQKRRKRYV